ncbi:MAG: AAA family ATPase [Lachnospiraceae bacterium]|nr:AAA family ATPase [Lachnospiraceae bacterium]
MGLFEKYSEEDKAALRRLDRIIDAINYTYKLYFDQTIDKSFLQYLTQIAAKPELIKIQPIKLFVEVVSTITANKTNYNINSYLTAIQNAEDIYPLLFPYGAKTPQFESLSMAFVNFFKEDGVAASGLFNDALMSTFKDKHNYIEFMNSFSYARRASDCIKDLLQYGLNVRPFFIDEDTYAANMKMVAQKMLKAGNRMDILKEETKKVEHMAGIYDIDEADVAKTEQQLLKASSMLNSTLDILEQADHKTRQLSRIMKDTTETIQEISKRETDLIAMRAQNAREDINTAYNQFLEEQRQEINLQKDILLGQIFQEAEDKLNELKTMARAVTASANTELVRINTEASSTMEKINHLVRNDESLNQLLAKADENQELMDRLTKLEILSNQNIEAITKSVEAQSAVPGQVPTIATLALQPGSSATVSDCTPAEILPMDIPATNPLLDSSVPFRQRFDLVMAEKERRIAAGEHFHKMFDDVITVLMENANPYLIGPSGCGKTYMVKQIASILNLDFIDIGYINEEYDLLGFQTATGSYSATNFYRCYKYGKIAFCDELDNSNSRATVKLNSFLANGHDACYSFPNGENVKRHDNFRIIAAGNTTGNGADANYNTREKIEESVQQRFTPIYVNYDNAVEKKILEDYESWYQFVVLFRMATDAWGYQNDCSAPGIITTRDTARIKQYLDNESLTIDKILDYEFIQTKDMEYLAFLSKHMGGRVTAYPAAKEIYELFAQKVEALRKKGGIR